MNTKVSFSNLVEISTDTGRVPDDAAADDANADADADEGFASNISSVTMTPNIGTSSHASLKSAFSRRQRQRIYFVCFHLPIILTHDDDTNEWKAIWAESLLAATEGSTIVRDYDAMWIGTVKCSSHPITTQKDKDAVTKILAEMHCTPLFLDENLQDMHYKGMCKQVLWPAFHNVDLLDLSASGMASGAAKANSKLSEIDSACDWDQSSLLAWWKAYCTNDTVSSICTSPVANTPSIPNGIGIGIIASPVANTPSIPNDTVNSTTASIGANTPSIFNGIVNSSSASQEAITIIDKSWR
jgi:hypothetical protein